jgi:hypothetical protein
MKRWLFFGVFLAVGVAALLAAVWLVLELTHRLPENTSAAVRALAIAGALVGSAFSLLAALWIAVRVATLLFESKR